MPSCAPPCSCRHTPSISGSSDHDTGGASAGAIWPERTRGCRTWTKPTCSSTATCGTATPRTLTACEVLTGAHLAKATDLNAWEVEEVAPDRHLVQARDLRPWFSGPLPQPDALDQARRDFGDMILTQYHLPIRWIVVGPAGFPDVHLGQYRPDLRRRCATSGVPAATADRTDHFEEIGLTVTYDESDLVRLMTLTSPAEPTLIGIRLLTRPAQEVFAHLRSANIEVADDGLVPEHGFRLRSVDGRVVSVSFGGWE